MVNVGGLSNDKVDVHGPQEIADFEDGYHGEVFLRLETYCSLECKTCGHVGKAETVESVNRFIRKHNCGPHKVRGGGGKVEAV